MIEFTRIDDATCVLRRAGYFMTAELYAFDGKVFAKYYNRFVRLSADHLTSVDGIRWTIIDAPSGFEVDSFGHFIAPGETLRIAAE